MKSKFFASLVAMLIAVTMSAQVKTITGTVIDDSGLPVIGASILEKGTTNGAITDLDGRFSLSIGTGKTIEVSSIGYKTELIVVDSRTVYDVILHEDTELLDEVVVVGYEEERPFRSFSLSQGGRPQGLYRIISRPDSPGPCSRCPGSPDIGSSWFIIIHPRSWSGYHQCQCRASVCS